MSSAKKIQIDYFALLREQRGCSEETVNTTARTPSELYQELQEKYGLSLPFSGLRIAINDEFKEKDSILKNGDRVVFIPPVAGG